MNRGSAPLSPYLALMAALCFGIAGVAAPQRGMAQGLLGAFVLLAAISLVMNLRWTVHSPWERRRRR
jgi:hypothetical protein